MSALGVAVRSLGASSDGVWLGTGDDYAIELIDWAGGVRRTVRWTGPSRKVTPEHFDAFRAEELSRLVDDDARERFRTEEWPELLGELPSRFPAYARFLVVQGNGLWVELYPRPGEPERTWHFLDAEGDWVRQLRIPADTRVLDAGADWFLVHVRDDRGAERLAVHMIEPVALGTARTSPPLQSGPRGT